MTSHTPGPLAKYEFEVDLGEGDHIREFYLTADMERVLEEAISALSVTTTWMEWWINQQECDCENEHRCGLRARQQELEEAQRILATLEGRTR